MNGVIYIDMLYLLNMILDAAAFWATARFMNIKAGFRRILLASALGALLSLIILLPINSVAMLPLALLLMLACFYILAPRKDIFFYIKSLGIYFLIAFAMAGAALGGKTLFADNAMQSSWKILAFAMAAAAATACYGINRLSSRWQRRSFCRNIDIIVNNKKVSFEGLIDTGNDLCDPISGSPAIIAELGTLSGLFPHQLYCELKQYSMKNPAAAISACDNANWQRRFRLLPYQSIGGNGILLGFKPDLAIIEAEEIICTDDVIVCFYDRGIAADCGVRAIINPSLMARADKRKVG